MKNKELALNKLDSIKDAILNVKSSSYRGNLSDIAEALSRLDVKVEELENLISIEDESFSNRPYRGI